MSISLTGLWVAGTKPHIGWAIGIAVQVLWVVYGYTTHQYGFIVGSIFYAIIYGRNYIICTKSLKALDDQKITSV